MLYILNSMEIYTKGYDMEIYEMTDDDVGRAVIDTLEMNTGKQIFTMRVLNNHREDNHIEFLAVFKSEEVINGKIFVEEMNGRMAFRIKANYI